jgi:ssDNA-binding Zn-finger/Zn-ribbon topoisomerase 1
MSQPIFTPEIMNCAKCGAKAVLIDWDFNGVWQVQCDNNHSTIGEYITRNRAVHKWNNKQQSIIKEG